MNNLEIDYITKRPHPDIRELTLKNGIGYPSDSELIMLMLGSGTQKIPIQELSKKVITAMNNSNQENLIQNLKSIEGMGISKTLAVAAALELGRRRNAYLKAVINKPSDIIPYIQHYAMENKEHFICASLNGAHEIMQIRVISIGTIDKTLIHPREIFSDPVAEHASAVICSHNHPFGPCIPSAADIESTRAIKNAANILGIAFLDHIILTKSEYFSFLEHEML